MASITCPKWAHCRNAAGNCFAPAEFFSNGYPFHCYKKKPDVCLTCGNDCDFEECHYCMLQREKKDYNDDLSPETQEKLKGLNSPYYTEKGD